MKYYYLKRCIGDIASFVVALPDSYPSDYKYETSVWMIPGTWDETYAH